MGVRLLWPVPVRAVLVFPAARTFLGRVLPPPLDVFWIAGCFLAVRGMAPARTRTNEHAPGSAAERSVTSPCMKSILVVEDERRIVQIATDYLQHAGFGVITAADGQEALTVARERRPDLVVLDLGLPRLDGIEVARRLRRESDVPIIMLTARAEE